MIIDYKQLTGIKRIPLHLWDVEGFRKVGHKPYMTKDEVNDLFDWRVSVQEKYDGKTMWEEKEIDGKKYILFYEDLSTVHSIKYVLENTSPKVYFDVYDGNKFLDTNHKVFYRLESLGYNLLINRIGFLSDKNLEYVDRILTRQIPKLLELKGQYSNKMEGFVIKNYDKQLFGKIVNPEFEEGIKENYIRRGRNKK